MGRLTQNEANDKLIIFKVGNDEVKLSNNIVKRYLVTGQGNVTDEEIMYFMKLCKARNLNPFVRDAYLIKYSDKDAATIVVAKDAIEKRAIQHPKYNGKEVGLYIIKKETGDLEKRNGTIYLKEKEEIAGAWCTVYRKDWDNPVTVEVNFDEYVGRKKDGTANINWANRPVTMITKVAKAQALREAFIEEISGMYEAEEAGINVNDLDDTPIEQKDMQNMPDVTNTVQETEIDDEDLKKELFDNENKKNPLE
ncbi:phage recombination protein Bet [Pseudoleptotrichia goodfellowii]|jgi:phage recombination protein bet|uniref:Phage recombination protein Bet n=1 Tax=Pseudoleptotrichia goodfellowii F0264 TaxID=596323 RepID=D0GLJ4_9FUSO|nr:phage recombination protein Bet [Pseudoleptotrichia goodfellowii]EEY35049.1 phage recombination protein Bet [Pseudoleptotrichia goodfellowii F0264]